MQASLSFRFGERTKCIVVPAMTSDDNECIIICSKHELFTDILATNELTSHIYFIDNLVLLSDFTAVNVSVFLKFITIFRESGNLQSSSLHHCFGIVFDRYYLPV